MSDKPKFPAETAKAVVRELLPHLEPACAKDAEGKAWLRVAGSLRRRKAMVGDIELVYCPAFGPVKRELFTEEGNLADDRALAVGLMEQLNDEAITAEVFGWVELSTEN